MGIDVGPLLHGSICGFDWFVGIGVVRGSMGISMVVLWVSTCGCAVGISVVVLWFVGIDVGRFV